MWTEAEVVGEETLPKGKKSLVFDNFSKNISNTFVLWDAIYVLETLLDLQIQPKTYFLVLEASFYNIDWHGGDGCNQA